MMSQDGRVPMQQMAGGDGEPPIMPAPGVVLVVDDDDDVRRFAAETLGEAGFEALEAGDAEAALRILQDRQDVKVLVSDVRMPGALNGFRLAQRVRERWPHIEIILISGYATPDRRDIAFDCDLLAKPFEADELVRRVALRARRVFI
jgi:two-component system, response regulator PdtaR